MDNTETSKIKIVKTESISIEELNQNFKILHDNVMAGQQAQNSILKGVHYSLLAVAILVVLCNILVAAVIWLSIIEWSTNLEINNQRIERTLSSIVTKVENK